MIDVRELLPLYALGALDADEARAVEQAVAGDASLAAELASYQHATDALGTGIAPVAPAPAVLTRLLASVGGGRFEAFAARLATLYDVGVERARELLGLIERPASWEVRLPGISLLHFDGGPATAGLDCGFVRMTPGTVFPLHLHLGEEFVTVLAGRIYDQTFDRMILPGEDYVQLEGTRHALVSMGDEDCIYASRVTNGIDFGFGRVQIRR